MRHSELFGHLQELGFASVRRGGCKFTFEPMMYVQLCRKGFTVRDELEAFCWLYDCAFTPNAETMTCDVKVPDYAYYDYWMERLSNTLDAMEEY